MIDFYYWPTPNGWKVSIMLEETGLPYTLKPVDIAPLTCPNLARRERSKRPYWAHELRPGHLPRGMRREGSPFRRALLHRRQIDGDLLPLYLPGAQSKAYQPHLLALRRRRRSRRLPPMLALPP